MATFILEDLETINVEKTMKEVLDHSITTLANDAKSMGYKPEYIFGIIQSQLLDMPIPIHIHQLNENTIPALWNEFRDVNQSNEDKGRPSLITEPFTIDITALSRTALRKAQEIYELKKHHGKGRRRNRIFLPNTNPNSLIPISNDDNLCLFRAIDILRAKAILGRNGFYEYQLNPGRQRRDVLNILRHMKIPENLESYSVEEFG